MKLKPSLWLPPPAIVAIMATLMWLFEQRLGYGSVRFAGQQEVVVLLVILGLVLMVLAAWQLHRANTTILPFVPEQTRQLVTGGIFRYSRNPIYVGDLLLLLAWAVWLGNGVVLVWLPVFIGYMNKMQIAAEERALSARFGDDYQKYCRKVRRWL